MARRPGEAPRHFPSTVKLRRIERNANRHGFDDPFHQVTFTIQSDWIVPMGVMIHVSGRGSSTWIRRD